MTAPPCFSQSSTPYSLLVPSHPPHALSSLATLFPPSARGSPRRRPNRIAPVWCIRRRGPLTSDENESQLPPDAPPLSWQNGRHCSFSHSKARARESLKYFTSDPHRTARRLLRDVRDKFDVERRYLMRLHVRQVVKDRRSCGYQLSPVPHFNLTTSQIVLLATFASSCFFDSCFLLASGEY